MIFQVIATKFQVSIVSVVHSICSTWLTIKGGATDLQCHNLVKDDTSNYVHFLDKKSVRIQRPLLLLVSWAEPSLSAS